MTRNGDRPDSPQEGMPTLRPTELPDDWPRRPDGWKLDQAVRRSHHAWEHACLAAEQAHEARAEVVRMRNVVDDMAEQLGRVAASCSRLEHRLGTVEAAPKHEARASHSEEALADLVRAQASATRYRWRSIAVAVAWLTAGGGLVVISLLLQRCAGG